MIFSRIFEKQGKTEIGPSFLKSESLQFLNKQKQSPGSVL